jgi:hypothetical protein
MLATEDMVISTGVTGMEGDGSLELVDGDSVSRKSGDDGIVGVDGPEMGRTSRGIVMGGTVTSAGICVERRAW